MGVTAAAVFSTNSMFHLPAFSKPKTGITIEIVYSPLVNTIRKDSCRSTVSVIRAGGNRQWNQRPPKDGTPGKTSKGDEINMLPKKKKGDEINIQSSPDSKSSQSSNKEEILSIFKRIQTSISQGDSSSSKKRSSKSSGDQKANIDELLKILRNSSTLDHVTPSNTKDEQQGLFTHQRAEREPKTDYSTTVNARPARPPSKFVKRSPIQSPINSNGKVEQRSPIQSPFNSKEKAEQRSPIQSLFNSKEKVELKTEETSPAANHDADEEDAVNFEEMKVSELKELAKSRGLKGYSKMKKSELVELLIRC